MNKSAKRQSSHEGLAKLKEPRIIGFLGGLFLLTTAVLAPNNFPNFMSSQSGPVATAGAETPSRRPTTPVSRINFGLSVSVDCPVAKTGANAQTGLFKMTNEAYRPLQLASKQKGMDENAYVFMGQRAAGADKDAPPESGMLFSANKSGSYSIFGFNTIRPAGEEPQVQFDAGKTLTLQQIIGGVHNAYGGVNTTITYDGNSPEQAFKFSVSCALSGN